MIYLTLISLLMISSVDCACECVGMYADKHSGYVGDVLQFAFSGLQYEGLTMEAVKGRYMEGQVMEEMFQNAKQEYVANFTVKSQPVNCSHYLSIKPPRGGKPLWGYTMNITIPQNWEGEMIMFRVQNTQNAQIINDNQFSGGACWRFAYWWSFSVKNRKYTDVVMLYNTFTNDIAYNTYNLGGYYSKPYITQESLYKPIVDIMTLFSQNAINLQPLPWVKNTTNSVQTITDLDMVQNCSLILKSKVFIIAGHPEYWTKTQILCLEKFQQGNGTLIYLAGNGIYWRSELDEETQDILEVVKDDPNIHQIKGHEGEIGGLWPSRSNMTGGYFTESYYCTGNPYQAINTSSWVYNTTIARNSSFKSGDLFARYVNPSSFSCIIFCNVYPNRCLDEEITGASGWEIDIRDSNSPLDYVLLAQGTNGKSINGLNNGPELILFKVGNSTVLGAGSMISPWALNKDQVFSEIVMSVIKKALTPPPTGTPTVFPTTTPTVSPTTTPTVSPTTTPTVSPTTTPTVSPTTTPTVSPTTTPTVFPTTTPTVFPTTTPTVSPTTTPTSVSSVTSITHYCWVIYLLVFIQLLIN